MNKNILILVSEFPPGPGGIADHAYNLSFQLSQHGFIVKVLTREREPFSKKVKPPCITG